MDTENESNQPKEPFWIDMLIRTGIVVATLGVIEGFRSGNVLKGFAVIITGLIIFAVGYAARK